MFQFNDGTVVIVSNELINAEIKNVVKMRPPFEITKFLIQCGGTRLIQIPRDMPYYPYYPGVSIKRAFRKKCPRFTLYRSRD